MLKTNRKDFIHAFVTAILIYTVTAVFSTGYHHFTEHLNLIDVILNRLRPWQQTDLPPDLVNGIIPGFQPFLAFLQLKVFSLMGIAAPSVQMVLIRLIMGYFTLIVMFVGLLTFLPSIKEDRLTQPMIFLTPLLWFMPYICVRFSQQTLSGALFFLAFAVILLKHREEKPWRILNWPWWLPGIIMGLSFSVNYLILVMVIGLILWLLIIGREKIWKILILLAGLLAGMGVGVLADRWLYGYWTWPFLNNLNWDLSGFSSDAWWFYLQAIFKNGGFVVGICVLFCLFYFWVRYFKNAVTWISIPLFIAVLFIPGRDVRHLFPLVFFLVFMIMYSAQDIIIQARRRLPVVFRRTGYYTIAFIFLLTNSAFLCLFAFKTADMDTDSINYMERQYHYRDIILLYADNSNPYEYYDLAGQQRMFHYPAKLEMYHVNSPSEISALDSRKDKMVVLCIRQKVLDQGFVIDKKKFVKVYESLPNLYFTLTANFWEKKKDRLILFQPRSCRLVF